MSGVTPHQQAISVIERFVMDNIGGSLEASANCNQCSEELSVNLVDGLAGVHREERVVTVQPDLCLVGGNEEPIRFIEVVDSHAPEAVSDDVRGCTDSQSSNDSLFSLESVSIHCCLVGRVRQRRRNVSEAS